MKSKEITKLSTEKLKKLLEDITLTQIQASSAWGQNLAAKREKGMYTKGKAIPGEKTSLQKDIRKNIARIKTELRRRELEE